jgi:ABC-type dipeptide/oligopeptide/nickel transport system permease subunit
VILIFAIVLFCIVGPLFSPYDMNAISIADMKAGPSFAHPFGCDVMGRDIMTRLMVGGRYSLILGIAAALLSAIAGAAIGLIAGYFGGVTENAIMRLIDVWSALPAMLLCIIMSAVLGPGYIQTIIALTIGGVPGSVRMIRGQVLAERGREYIEAAESFNCSRFSIMFRHLLPNTVQPLIVTTTMSIGGVIGMAASLSYIGLGIQPPTPEWGAMLADSKAYILTEPHMIMFPGLIIAVTVLAINLIGDGLRDALDPKLRG